MKESRKKPSNQKSFFFKDYLEPEINFDNSIKKSIKVLPKRVTVLFFIFFSLISIFSVKIIYLSLFPEKNLNLVKERKNFSKERADIIDSNDIILARNIEVYSVGVRSKLVKNREKLLINLRLIFPDLDFKKIEKKLNDSNFFYIKRRLTEDEKTKLWLLGDKSVTFEKEEVRIYPQQNLFR